MARYPKMTESISVAEMLHMRNEEHMTNRQIAGRLGCGMNTVRKYIGNQPEDMPRGRGPSKKNLPSLPAKEIHEMPRKSFAQRLEESLGASCTLNKLQHAAEEFSKKLENFSPAGPHITEADKAREAHVKEKIAEPRSPVHELLAVFGPDEVRAYLKIALYAYGNPYVGPMTRNEMLSALKTLNAEGTLHD